MKNPWMSAWFSMANRGSSAARGRFLAEMSRAHGQMVNAWQRAWLDCWTSLWLAGSKRK